MKSLLLAILAALLGSALAADDLRIGVEGEYPPFSEVNTEGELFGFDIDIANALCEQMNRECELVQISWDGLIPALKTGKIDAIVASMTATEERKKSVDFTEKYYDSNGRLVLRSDKAGMINDDNLSESLSGKVLGVQRATTHDSYATNELADVVGEIKRYNSQDEANLDLVAGRIDMTLADQVAMLTGFLDTEMGEGYNFAAPAFDDTQYYGEGVSIAVRKGDDGLREAFNQAILDIRDSGVYQTINDQYFSEDIY
ncbi:transporter substrate-binding domain-containing protein [Suttonella sp. R2A3]|uniref:transporter substrate-binding domain-containing protein n=1 Tax=Suttonella sp. R2A3 TaxID=2908648 RepID=UPI001F386BEF|nr:transporter substrate-binding domain-containing protein [Suttonella sp. R2A3]UJF24916.1 transporter substrate-binding domain-containing protein [Suttonella sp. R2A3]